MIHLICATYFFPHTHFLSQYALRLREHLITKFVKERVGYVYLRDKQYHTHEQDLNEKF